MGADAAPTRGNPVSFRDLILQDRLEVRNRSAQQGRLALYLFDAVVRWRARGVIDVFWREELVASTAACWHRDPLRLNGAFGQSHEMTLRIGKEGEGQAEIRDFRRRNDSLAAQCFGFGKVRRRIVDFDVEG